jgi:hypothetical protein
MGGSLVRPHRPLLYIDRVTAGRPVPTHSGHGWLAAVLPADARRFRVSDPEVAAVLGDAGAELVDQGEEVEIARPDELHGGAALAIASLGGTVPDEERVLPLRAGARLATFAAVRRETRRAQARMRSLRYPEVQVLPWDVGHALRLPGLGGSRRRAVELLPQRALVIGRRPGTGSTLLEAALSNAEETVGERLASGPASVRQGVLVVTTTGGILRIAVGRDGQQLSNQLSALAALGSAELPAVVSDRVPWPLASAEQGLAFWSLERRLAGQRPRPALSDRVLADCVDFLVALHGVPGAGSGSLADEADVVASAGSAEGARIAHELAQRLEERLRDVPRGFGHGDFFRGNLLVAAGRLVGVVDWDAAGPGRLPLVDLLHLRHMSDQRPADNDWGRLLVDRLLPRAESGDPTILDYCRRVGIDAGPDVVRSLVFAYWLGHAAYQLRSHPHRRDQPAWLAGNIEHVLRVAERDILA